MLKRNPANITYILCKVDGEQFLVIITIRQSQLTIQMISYNILKH